MELITIIRKPLRKGLSDTQRAVLRGFQTKNDIEDKEDDNTRKSNISKYKATKKN